MNSDSLLFIILAIIFSILGVLMLLGKVDFMIKGHYIHSQRYNIARLRIINAATFFLAGLLFILLLCDVSKVISVCIIIPTAIVLAILQYTWARIK